MPDFLYAVGYFAGNYGEPPLLVGVAGLVCGLLLPNLRWWIWLLIGCGLGLVSVITSAYLFFVSPYEDIDSAVRAYWLAWTSHALSKLVPLVLVIYLAIRMNARRANI